MNTTYARLIFDILEMVKANSDIVHFGGEGDIYAVNSLNIKDYPVFWVSNISPVQVRDNTVTYTLTMYYIDRETFNAEQKRDGAILKIHSDGIVVLGSVVDMLKHNISYVISVNKEYNITFFEGTQLFGDSCSGVYADINITVPRPKCIDMIA